MIKKMNKDFTDSDLLTQVFIDVKPLPGRKIDHVQSASAQPVKPLKPSISAQALVSETKYTNTNLPEIKHGEAPSLDKHSARKLRQGRLPVEDHLDLHGLRQDEACSSLASFLDHACHADKRCVLVITGKGDHSQGDGVLRKMVPRWLNQTPNREKILSFNYARPRDGGNGALYVLLKRNRK